MLTSERLEELMQQQIDGANTPEETADLARALQDDAAARERYEALRTTATALDEGREAVESPAGLHEAVLQALPIEAPRIAPARVPAPVPGRAHERRRLRPGVWNGPFWKKSEGSRDRVSGRGAVRGVGGFSNEKEGRNMAGKSKAFIVGGFVVGLGLIAYLGFVRPPSNGDVSGTIGAAKKYRSETMTPADVVLGDQETQQILQSAEFHRLMADPDARKLLGSHAFAEAMGSADFRKVITDKGFQQALANPVVAGLLQNPDFRAVAENVDLANLMSNPKVVEFFASPEFYTRQQRPGDLASSPKAAPELAAKQQNLSGFAGKVPPQFDLAMKNENFARLVANPDFAHVMQAGLGPKVLTADLFKISTNPAFGEILKSPELARAVVKPEFGEFMAKPNVAGFMLKPEFAAALNAAASADLGAKTTAEN